MPSPPGVPPVALAPRSNSVTSVPWKVASTPRQPQLLGDETDAETDFFGASSCIDLDFDDLELESELDVASEGPTPWVAAQPAPFAGAHRVEVVQGAHGKDFSHPPNGAASSSESEPERELDAAGPGRPEARAAPEALGAGPRAVLATGPPLPRRASSSFGSEDSQARGAVLQDVVQQPAVAEVKRRASVSGGLALGEDGPPAPDDAAAARPDVVGVERRASTLAMDIVEECADGSVATKQLQPTGSQDAATSIEAEGQAPLCRCSLAGLLLPACGGVGSSFLGRRWTMPALCAAPLEESTAAVSSGASYAAVAREVCERSRVKVLEAAAKDGFALQYASEEVCADREVVLCAVAQSGRALKFASRVLRDDQEIVLAAVAQDGRALEYASSALRADWVVVQTAVAQNGWALRFAAEEFRADPEVVRTAVAGDAAVLRFAAPGLRADRDLVKATVAQNGWVLRWASPELRADRDVVLTAVAQSGLALEFASDELRADREIVRAALAQDPSALECAADELLADRDIVTAAVLVDGSLLELASEDLRADPDLVLAAAGEDGATFPYVPPEKRELYAAHNIVRASTERPRMHLAERHLSEGDVPQVRRETLDQVILGFASGTWSL